jgi:hypothetical protein
LVPGRRVADKEACRTSSVLAIWPPDIAELPQVGGLNMRQLTLAGLLFSLLSSDAGPSPQPQSPPLSSLPNQRACTIIVELAGTSDMLSFFPVTGEERVSNALASVPCLRSSAGKFNISLRRQKPGTFNVFTHTYTPSNGEEVIDIDGQAVLRSQDSPANLVLLPGDRLRVTPKQDPPGGPGYAHKFDPAERIRQMLLSFFPGWADKEGCRK